MKLLVLPPPLRIEPTRVLSLSETGMAGRTKIGIGALPLALPTMRQWHFENA